MPQQDQPLSPAKDGLQQNPEYSRKKDYADGFDSEDDTLP
jgi:hypothetical protein